VCTEVFPAEAPLAPREQRETAREANGGQEREREREKTYTHTVVSIESWSHLT